MILWFLIFKMTSILPICTNLLPPHSSVMSQSNTCVFGTYFSLGEKLLCTYGSLIYDAKCVKADRRRRKYLIHYIGWNKNWDEWVTEKRMLKYNKQNVERQKQLQENFLSERRKKSRRFRSGHTKISNVSGPANRVTDKIVISSEDSSSDSDSEYGQTPMDDCTHMHIPDKLKDWLVCEENFIECGQALIDLPAEVPVDHILDGYLQFVNSIFPHNDCKKKVVAEVVAGLREYFNVLLESQLLYECEYSQYADVLRNHPRRPMSQIYGATHLLRLIVRLDQLLVECPPKKDVTVKIANINELLIFLASNEAAFFTDVFRDR